MSARTMPPTAAIAKRMRAMFMGDSVGWAFPHGVRSAVGGYGPRYDSSTYGVIQPPSRNTLPWSAGVHGVSVKVTELASAAGRWAGEISGTQSCSRSVVTVRVPPAGVELSSDPDSAV